MPNAISEAPAIERFLTVRGWFKGDAAIGSTLVSPNGEWAIEIAETPEALWALFEVSRPADVTYGETLAELERDAVSLGAVAWWCPNCGDEGGEPREFYDRYFYGADADGNRGEWREDTIDGCSKCIYNGRMVR